MFSVVAAGAQSQLLAYLNPASIITESLKDYRGSNAAASIVRDDVTKVGSMFGGRGVDRCAPSA